MVYELGRVLSDTRCNQDCIVTKEQGYPIPSNSMIAFGPLRPHIPNNLRN